MTPARVTALFDRLARANPAPTTELHFETPFQLLVSVILSAQATDRSVNEATRTLFAIAPDAQRLGALPVSTIEHHIRHIGLFRTKARHIQQTSQRLQEAYHGDVPCDRAALESLPGVGRKTANVVLNTVFGEPCIAVDTHIFRVANRTGLAPGKTVAAVEAGLMAVVPEHYRRHAHHWLILHGRYCCTARTPHCRGCPLVDLCQWPDRNPPS